MEIFSFNLVLFEKFGFQWFGGLAGIGQVTTGKWHYTPTSVILQWTLGIDRGF